MIRIKNKAKLVAFLILAASLLPGYTETVMSEEVSDNIDIQLHAQDVKCLAKNIYYESRGEPTEGKVAVGIVTLNRVNHPSYPDTVCDVVHHKTKTNSGKYICQFSWTCNKRIPPKETDPIWRESVNIAMKLLLGEYTMLQQKYKKAYYFHNTSVSPQWRTTQVARVGRHIFYR